MAFPLDPNAPDPGSGFGLPRDKWGRVILPTDDGYRGERFVRLPEDARALADADAAIREYADQGIAQMAAFLAHEEGRGF